MAKNVKTLEIEAPEIDLSSHQWFLNRELTWLEFNRRVLAEGQDKRNPLLERVNFLAIISSNFDEFFMKRIGGLKQQVGAELKKLSDDGRTPQQQIDESYQVVRDILGQQQLLEDQLLQQLRKKGIQLLEYGQLNDTQRKGIDAYFLENIYPLLTPQGMDPAHPFPFISNLSLNLLVSTHHRGNDHIYLNRIKVPTGVGIPRFIRIAPKQHLYVRFEDVIANNLETVFPGMVIASSELFRVTRNAVTENTLDQAIDLLSMIESALRDRKFAEIVRLEVSDNMSRQHRGMLAAELGIDSRKDVFTVKGIMDKRDLFQIVGLDLPELHFPIHQPLDHFRLAGDFPNIFHQIREEGTILLQHPYESFSSSVERFLMEASCDPKVLAIKMTLYRTSSDSRIIQYLLDAAHNGKQVAVVVELMARFDESANIHWASALEEAGVHVTYGVVGLKTHSKVIFVVRQDYGGLKRYAHIGTGNYHSGTARLYSDLGILTCDHDIGTDLTELFNYLTMGYAPLRNYTKLLPSPKVLKATLLEYIQQEIQLHSEKCPGLIQFKTNALTDSDIITALYQASRAGVQVDLLVRDSCLLRPGLPDLSHNIRVVSIVGRFLEHARIYYFQHKNNEKYFIGSADLMKRNLERRVEVITPIETAELRSQLREIIDLQLDDQRGAWDMQPDGSYIQRHPRGRGERRCSQEICMERSAVRLAEAKRRFKKEKYAKKIAKRKKK
ncbi:polyphosphate kinase 1 [Desulfogranum mediterraneum]|uniref:polyphosphate kinase 1 n=1 Tax=Desulfogranum mediterraneum TaxID=160661 RepID=UPI000490F5DE|nr:polyphosphate kinase 1 [Desulfogranum mediterraneum]